MTLRMDAYLVRAGIAVAVLVAVGVAAARGGTGPPGVHAAGAALCGPPAAIAKGRANCPALRRSCLRKLRAGSRYFETAASRRISAAIVFTRSLSVAAVTSLS